MASGKEENKVVAEGRALLSVTPGVFYSDHQVLQRDLSVAVLRAYRQFALEGSLRPASQRRHPSPDATVTSSNNNCSSSSSSSSSNHNNNNDDDNGGVSRIGGLHVGRHGNRDEAPRGRGGGKEENGCKAEGEDPPLVGGGGELGAAARVLRVCDVLAGGGVRAIRYALEAGPVEVLANDHSEE
ncbi:unnamed protein product, partial [Ectocarpus fasciculatus]